MQIEYGVWDHFERRSGVSTQQQYAEKIDFVRRAEALGFSYYHIAEHHLTPLDLAPSPSVFLAALAQATSRIRLGSGVLCLPLYHPVRLVQELCMLDNLSGGRLDIGVGRGIRATEHQWFGVAQDEVQGRFNETLAIMLDAFTTGRIDHHGTYYNFDGLTLDVQPLQQPHPPLWYAGGAETAGQYGFNFLGRTSSDINRYWRLFREDGGKAGRVNTHLAAPMGAITRHLVIRENYEAAERIARRAWPEYEAHFFAMFVLVNREGGAAPLGRTRTSVLDEALQNDRRVVAGTPSIVRERLEEWLSELDSDLPAITFAPAVQWGDIDHDEAVESLELLAEVMKGLQSHTTVPAQRVQ